MRQQNGRRKAEPNILSSGSTISTLARINYADDLIKQRENSKLTVREVSERLGSKSPNAYAQYEKGRVSVTLEKYEELLTAVNPFQHHHIRVGIV